MTKKRQPIFTLSKLKNDVFEVTENKRYIFMPNEIFKDLLERFEDEEKAKSSTHIAFAYAYTYLAHYMYRYCKYEYYETYYEVKNIDEKMIRQVLGFPAKSDQYTYITKKGGILDELGYIRKESDVPIEPIVLNDEGMSILERNNGNGMPIEMELAEAARNKGVFKISHFVMASWYPEIYGNSKNRKINFPVKAFYRDEKQMYHVDDCEDGTFWEIENTHMIDFDVFAYCMSDAELGVKGFYLYCFLQYMSDRHSNSFDCSIERFVTQTGLGIRTVRDQLVRLEKRNMITNDHKPYCLDKKQWQIPKSNTYGVLPYSGFISNASEFKEIPEQRRISAKRYEKEIGFVSYEDDSEIGTDTNQSNGNEPDKQKTKRVYRHMENSIIYNSEGAPISLPF